MRQIIPIPAAQDNYLWKGVNAHWYCVSRSGTSMIAGTIRLANDKKAPGRPDAMAERGISGSRQPAPIGDISEKSRTAFDRRTGNSAVAAQQTRAQLDPLGSVH
jgi:hypothetical protein